MSATAATGTTTATAILPGADKPLDALFASALDVEGGAVADEVEEERVELGDVVLVSEGNRGLDAVEVRRTVTGWLLAPVVVEGCTVTGGPATTTGVEEVDVDDEDVEGVGGTGAGAGVVGAA